MGIKNIKKDIIKNIYRGSLNPNDKLDSIAISSEKYNVSSTTIKNAYNQLSNMGVLYKKQGKGFYVTEYWDANIISSPSLEDNIYKTELIWDDLALQYIKKYDDHYEMTKKGKWKKFVKFYYDKSSIIKFNMVIINMNVIKIKNIKDIEDSFISYLYNNDYFPSKEIVNVKIRKHQKYEKEILSLNSDLVVEETITTFSDKEEVICFSKWIINPLFYKTQRFKGNY